MYADVCFLGVSGSCEVTVNVGLPILFVGTTLGALLLILYSWVVSLAGCRDWYCSIHGFSLSRVQSGVIEPSISAMPWAPCTSQKTILLSLCNLMVQASISSRCCGLLAASLSPAPDSETGKFQYNWRQDLCESNRAGLEQEVIAGWISGNLVALGDSPGSHCEKDNCFPLPSTAAASLRGRMVTLVGRHTVLLGFKISKYGLLAYHASIPLLTSLGESLCALNRFYPLEVCSSCGKQQKNGEK